MYLSTTSSTVWLWVNRSAVSSKTPRSNWGCCERCSWCFRLLNHFFAGGKTTPPKKAVSGWPKLFVNSGSSTLRGASEHSASWRQAEWEQAVPAADYWGEKVTTPKHTPFPTLKVVITFLLTPCLSSSFTSKLKPVNFPFSSSIIKTKNPLRTY